MIPSVFSCKLYEYENCNLKTIYFFYLKKLKKTEKNPKHSYPTVDSMGLKCQTKNFYMMAFLKMKNWKAH